MAKIKIYTTPTCPYCEMAKEYFQENNVGYEEYNVAEDDKARDEMIEKSQQMGVPVIDIDGKIIIGFNKPEIEKALKYV
ncbi:MAG: Uxx-star family glutaredoxin-like (seleno)protein [Patescibacteria group bacterium]